MKVGYPTSFVFVLWLIVAASYWNTSHCVVSHTLWKGYANSCHVNVNTHNLKSNLKTPCFYASPYWNLIHLNKTPTQLKLTSQQLTNVKYENSKLLHACCSNSHCYKTSKVIKSKVYVKELKNFFPITNIQVGPQLNLWNGYGKGVIRGMDLVKTLQKTYDLLEHCMCNRMTTSTNVAATTRKLFEQNVDVIDVLV
jgi:hypothetical protein